MGVALPFYSRGKSKHITWDSQIKRRSLSPSFSFSALFHGMQLRPSLGHSESWDSTRTRRNENEARRVGSWTRKHTRRGGSKEERDR